MSFNFVKRFHVSAGLILVGMAMALLVGNQGQLVTQPSDPVFAVSSRYLFWIVAGVEFTAAMICLSGRSPGFKSVSVFWLTSNLLIYGLFLFYSGVRSVKAYYDTMAYSFGVSANVINVLLTLVMVYLWLGSGLSLLILRKKSKQPAIPQSETNVVPT